MNTSEAQPYPRTIYITGAARSGSTLLGEVLGAQHQVLNIGEISLFWRDAHRRNRCACGESIPECELWSQALASVSFAHGVGAADFASLARTRARLARTLRFTELRRLRRSTPSEWPADVRLLVDATRTLVAAAARTSSSDVVVDTSKTLPGVLFLDLCGAEYDILHLVRRPEAVASSALRSKSVRRGNVESQPPGGNLSAGVGRWAWSNVCSLAAPRVSTPATYQRLHYEDFTRDVEGTVDSLCTSLGLDIDARVVQGNRVSLPAVSHAAVGNPSRGAREVTVAEDTRWREELSPRQARVIALTTAPVRWRL